MKKGKDGIYNRYIKRILDICCTLAAMIVFCWLYAIVAILVRIKLGSPVIFKQARPGKNEKIFNLYKFCTMTDERDKNGELLPDDMRLTKFGRLLRSTSLDGKVIIGTTTESLENKGFREVSPIHFFSGRDHFSDYRIEDYGYGETLLLA